MSKKKKKKYYQQSVNNVSNVANTSGGVAGTSQTSSMATASFVKPAVVDKLTPVYNAHAEEYKIVRHDLIRVVVVNGLFLAAVLALYFSNKSNPFLEAWYQKLF